MNDMDLRIEQESLQQPTAMPLSEQIGKLLEAFAEMDERYAASVECVAHTERLTQDLLHALELEVHDYHQRARIATELTKCRRQRRPEKDQMQSLEPLIGYLRSKNGQTFLRQLEHVQKQVRRAESPISRRRYSPRVLTQDEYCALGQKTRKKSKAPQSKAGIMVPPKEETMCP